MHMTNNDDMIDDRPTLDDLHATISMLRASYRDAKARGDLQGMRNAESQHRSAMRTYRAMQMLRAQGKDPRDYFNS